MSGESHQPPAGDNRARDNLVFIVGVPRSGTTWLLSILENHPGCLGISPEMLGIATDHPTKETGLFVRGFADAEIVEKVSRLPHDKVLIEKTPSHLFELGRIRKLFPRSKIILIRRDPLDILYSMVQSNSFWKNKPKTLSEAVEVYRRFAEAQESFRDYDYVLDYEKLVEDPVGEATSLFEHLHLGTDRSAEIVENTKEARSLPAELRSVFRKGTPGEGSEKFSRAELNFIRRKLGRLSEGSQSLPSARPAKSAGNMAVLLTNHLLRSYTGSEIFTYTIADFLRRRGIEVVAYSKYIGGTVQDFAALGVRVAEDLDSLKDEKFDIAHVHHNINALETRYHFRELPMVFLSHGVLPFLEQPPQIDLGISKFLAVSEEVRENLIAHGVKESDIEIFRNLVDSGKFRPTSRINATPHKALILSYRIDSQTEEAIRRACGNLEIECKFAGGRFGEVAQHLLPQHINDADIVFSLGRGAIETMFCGRVPIVFDYAGGDGMVTPENIREIMKHNFSGRRYDLHFTAEELTEDIQKYDAGFGDALRNIALEHFDADRHIDRLIEIYTRHRTDEVPALDETRAALLEAFVNSVEETRTETYRHIAAKAERERDSAIPGTRKLHLRAPRLDRVELNDVLKEIARAAVEDEDTEVAETFFNLAMQYCPESTETRHEYALFLQSAGKTEKALRELHALLAADPQNSGLHNDVGALYFQQGDAERALSHFQQAATLDPANLVALKNAAAALLRLGRTQEALKTYQDILKRDPRDIETLLVLGRLCLQAGRSEKAAYFFKKVLEIDPANSAAKLNLDNRIAGTGSTSHEALSDIRLSPTRIGSYKDYRDYVSERHSEIAEGERFEGSLIKDSRPFTLPGRCYPCNRDVEFVVDYRYSYRIDGVLTPSWREGVVCPLCGLNSRMRASIHLFEELLRPDKESAIYISEQTTPLYAWFARNYRHVVGSEYLGDSVPLGETNAAGIRNESLTRLSFPDNPFDFVLSFDVFEHIPDFQRAFREVYRVLKPAGNLFFTVPLQLDSEKNFVCALVNVRNEIEHIRPPQYHGDPLNPAGCLAFQDFGWELLDQVREAGFAAVDAFIVWSAELGYLGRRQIVFLAGK